ncbi:MAG: ABC transporter substrate-binding protein [Mycobacteriaceae bacterium]
MSRSKSEPSQPAGASVPSLAASFTTNRMSRRTVLRGALGGAALVGLPGLLAACGSDSSSSSGGAAGGTKAATGAVTYGSNQSDAVPKKSIAEMVAAYQKQSKGVTVSINTIDHNSFQENINNYLQGNPDDVFTWFSGFRMKFFANKGLAGDLSDVWTNLPGMSDALKKASTADDGKQYFVPATTYPWAMFYRPSIFKAKGYEVPKTMDEFYTLSAQMKKDKLIPLAFADKDGWPAMGTFDQLNLRLNGYDFHISLMDGKEAWNSPKVKNVFDAWRKLLEVSQPDSLGRTWQEAATSLQKNEAATYVLGMFVGQQFTKGADQDDLDFFAFPELDSNIGTSAIEAPIDGNMMASRPKNKPGAENFLAYLGSPEAQQLLVSADPTVIATNSKADTSKYTALQKKAVEFIGNAKQISQFMDRDTRPDFASTVMIPALQTFIGNPKDIDGLTNSIESQKKTIFVS